MLYEVITMEDLAVDFNGGFQRRPVKAADHVFGLAGQFVNVVAAGFAFDYHQTGNDVAGLAAADNPDIGGGQRRCRCCRWWLLRVITSYSIHYTKLYENPLLLHELW